MTAPRIYPSHYPNSRMTRGSGAAAALRQSREACTQATPPAARPAELTPTLPHSAGHLDPIERYGQAVIDFITVMIGLAVFGGLAFFCLVLTL